MKKLVCALVLAGFVSSAYAQFGDESIRFFFDTKGVAEGAARAAADPLAFGNPVQNNGAGADAGQRYYMYVQYGTANQQFNGVNLVINTTLGAVMRGGSFYNKAGLPGGTRWLSVPTGSPVNGSTTWTIGSVLRSLPGGYGARNNDVSFANTETNDSHFKADDGSTNGTTLLGYVDVDHTGNFGDPDGEIRFQSGTSGHAGVTITSGDTLFYGFGDAGTTNKAGRTSATADATIHVVPEPATLALLGLGALALRRRR